jgi:hypothetical protein
MRGSMGERKITVLDGADLDPWIGIDADRPEKVFMTFNPGTEHEVRVYLDPLRASFCGQQLELYAEQILARHVQVLERYEENAGAVTVDRERPRTLDS